MNLKEMCEIGYRCGSETIGDAFQDAVLYLVENYSIDEATHIAYDLMIEITEAGCEEDTRILDVFPEFKELGE